MSQQVSKMDIELLKKLSEADGIGGCEREVYQIVKEEGERYADRLLTDAMGSLVLVREGHHEAPKIMLSSHMDEVGFMVKRITPEGYLLLLPVGGWWGHVMPAQEMRVTTATGEKYIGVVGSRAPHGMPKEEKEKVMTPQELYLDLGVPDRAYVERLGIQIGDMITPHTTCHEMNDPDYLIGKAWDDRVCVGVGLEVIRHLSSNGNANSVYFAATVQEEVGIRGARTAVHLIQPDVAIALDVTTAEDTPLDKGGLALGGGCTLSILDSLTLANRSLFSYMKKLVEAMHLDVRFDFMTVGGTDACNIHKAMDGVITMTVSIPTRYMHSSRLIIHKKDYEQTIQLLTAFCQQLTKEDLQQFRENLVK